MSNSKAINRTRYLVYRIDYYPGRGYHTCYSWYQAKKLCKQEGVECNIVVTKLLKSKGSNCISFWNTEHDLRYNSTTKEWKDSKWIFLGTDMWEIPTSSKIIGEQL